jgi:hypothetical protein
MGRRIMTSNVSKNVFEVDIRSEPFNPDENSLPDVLEMINEALEEFKKEVNGRRINFPSLQCSIIPISDGDKYFWIGCSLQEF